MVLCKGCREAGGARPIKATKLKLEGVRRAFILPAFPQTFLAPATAFPVKV